MRRLRESAHECDSESPLPVPGSPRSGRRRVALVRLPVRRRHDHHVGPRRDQFVARRLAAEEQLSAGALESSTRSSTAHDHRSRVGNHAMSRRRPPGVEARSCTFTACPRSAAVAAVRSPAGPPPITIKGGLCTSRCRLILRSGDQLLRRPDVAALLSRVVAIADQNDARHGPAAEAPHARDAGSTAESSLASSLHTPSPAVGSRVLIGARRSPRCRDPR